MDYPAEAIEYVVVHELAHIRHHDHSPAFYGEVARYLPDWRSRRALLKNRELPGKAGNSLFFFCVGQVQRLRLLLGGG